MRINIEVIPHKEQRYDTAGDYWLDEERVLQVRVSKMGNEKFQYLVLIHELVEALTAIADAGPEFERNLLNHLDEFDKAYEAKRPKDDESSEPGYDPLCPVYEEHMAASAIEHVIAMMWLVDYNEYQKAIESLE